LGALHPDLLNIRLNFKGSDWRLVKHVSALRPDNHHGIAARPEGKLLLELFEFYDSELIDSGYNLRKIKCGFDKKAE
jgi:hypothetical protein